MPQDILDDKTDKTSSVSSDANREASSSSEKTSDKEPLSSLEVALATAATTPGGEGEVLADGETQEDESPDGDVLKQNKTGEGEEDEGGEKEEEVAEDKPEGESEDDEDAEDDDEEAKKKDQESRLDKNPRFRELNERVKTLEPLAKEAEVIRTYCSQNRISTQEMAQALELVAMTKNPAKYADAKRILEPLWIGLNSAMGEILPKDLQQEVDDAKLTVERAKEIAKLRAGQTVTAQTQEQDRVQRFQQEVNQGINSWVDLKKKSDPDWDFKLPFLQDAYQARMASPESARLNPQQRVALLEKVYTEVTQRVVPLRPTPKKKAPPLSGGSVRTKEAPKSSLEVALATVRKHSR